MNSQTTSPATDALAAMLQNATIEKVVAYENAVRNRSNIVYHNTRSGGPISEVENSSLEFHDAINYLLNAVPLFVEDVRQNDQSRSTIAKKTSTDLSDLACRGMITDRTIHPVLEDIVRIIPPELTSLPVTGTADRYTRSMLKSLIGYPLYNPKPFSDPSNGCSRNGVMVGDVGFIRGDGTFCFLFNISTPQTGMIDPPTLPIGFSLEAVEHSVTTTCPWSTSLLQSPITKTESGEYICEGTGGAILELPEGAIGEEAVNMCSLEKLAGQYGVQWYEYAKTQDGSISNGSLYLITSLTKCAQWGIAVFDRPCGPGQGLRFDEKRTLSFGKSRSKYHWKGSRTFHTKVSNTDLGAVSNQCVFVRGYKIMIQEDIFDQLPPRSYSTTSYLIQQEGRTSSMAQKRARGRGWTGSLSRLINTCPLSQTSVAEAEEGVTSSLVHPSDIINIALLSQNPRAKVALTHDNVWCDLLRDNFPKLNHRTLVNLARSYEITIDDYDCVLIAMVPHPSNDLQVNSCLLQDSQVPIAQIPHTLSNDSYAPHSAPIPLGLPHELIERILLLLDAESILKCTLVNREFNEIVQSSTLVQYFLACKVAGVVDNPQSLLSCSERFEALRKREDAWRKLTPVFETTIKVSDRVGQPSKLYELTAGNYFLTNTHQTDLYYCHLPSSFKDSPYWARIPGNGSAASLSGNIVDIGMAIYEHDLIVIVVFSEVGNPEDLQPYSLDLVLLKFSTGEHHPLACHPWIHIQRSHAARPYVVPRIVGDNIALIVYSLDIDFPDKLFILDWKTGQKRLEHETTECAYSGLVFVSPELLLVPNHILSHFEVWYLPPFDADSNFPVQILSLAIPAISDDYSIFTMECYGEFSPFLHSMPYFPLRPFFPSPENSIIIVNLRLQSFPGPVEVAYTLIMHRHALLDTIQKWTSPSLPEQKSPPWSMTMNDVTVHKVADADGSIIYAQSKIASITPDMERSPPTGDSPTFATSEISTTSPTLHIPVGGVTPGIFTGSFAAPSASRYDIFQIQWTDWGPSISRWFQANENHVMRVNHSTGQRYVLIDPNPDDMGKFSVSVADFNPYHVKRDAELKTQLEGEGRDNGTNSDGEERTKKETEGFEILDQAGVFSEDVYMGLQCVVYNVPGEYEFDRVLMDEERLLGLKLDHDGRDESIRVLYFG